jgi:anti-sigma factor RsiW
MSMADDELLQRYFDEALPPEDRAALEARFTEEDRERLASLGEVRETLRSAFAAEAPTDLRETVKRRLRRRKQRRRGFRVSSFGLAAACVALLVLFRLRPLHAPTNECDIESLEVEGSMATVFRVSDTGHESGPTTTIIWTEEE